MIKSDERKVCYSCPPEAKPLRGVLHEVKDVALTVVCLSFASTKAERQTFDRYQWHWMPFTCFTHGITCSAVKQAR
ncbi:MAG: hypothetical protein LBN71_08565 [Tannerella sp.]|nr:hypothetical protein [Tannerella sp.]